MAKQQQRAPEHKQDAKQVRSVMAAALAALAEGRQTNGLFPEGIGSIELKVSIGGTEVSLRAAGVGTPPWTLAGATASRTSADAAGEILKNGSIKLLDSHSSGNKDDATALDNITDTSYGKPAKRSSYNTAPGGTVSLSLSMLDGILALAKTYTMSVSEVAGGEHGVNSRHYAGVAFDVAMINGKKVDENHPDFKGFMADAKAAGATEVLGPGDNGHNTHVHAAWPRPMGPLGTLTEPSETYCESPD